MDAEISALIQNHNISEEELEALASYNISAENSKCVNASKEDPLITTGVCNLTSLQSFYLPLHGYISLIICILGTIFNIVNLVVLSHKEMRVKPINFLLMGIAVADMLVMLEYIPFSIHMYIVNYNNKMEKFSRPWAIFLLFHSNFSIMIHTVSIWLTLSLAIWRFIMIKFPTKSVQVCTLERCKIVLFAGFVVPLFLTIPSFFSFEIQKKNKFKNGECLAYYSVEISKFYGSEILFTGNMWLYGIILKLLPCIVLIVFTCGLIHAMYQADSKSAKLKQKITVTVTSTERRKSVIENKRSQTTDRTTNLLIVILVSFLISELPMGVLGMLSAILGKPFFMSCYVPVGEQMDVLALLNSSLNFILYCLMSSQFRNTLSSIFWNKKNLLSRKNEEVCSLCRFYNFYDVNRMKCPVSHLLSYFLACRLIISMFPFRAAQLQLTIIPSEPFI